VTMRVGGHGVERCRTWKDSGVRVMSHAVTLQARANAHLAVVGNTLWLLGGLVEVRDCRNMALRESCLGFGFRVWAG